MNEDDDLEKLRRLMVAMPDYAPMIRGFMEDFMGVPNFGPEPPHYWHHDEDFAAFMDKVLEPTDGADMG